MKEDAFTDVLDTNLTGAYRVAKRAVRGMMKMRRGRMIFISSVVGLYGSGGQANYAASKSGMVGLARSLARELGSRGITANVVAPGFVESDMTAVLSRGPQGADHRRGAARPVRVGGRGGRRGRLPRWPGRGIRHRRGDPGRRRPRHGSLEETTDGHSRRQADPGDRRAHRRLDRLPRGARGAGAGRDRGAHRVPPADPGGADRQAAAAAGPGDRARRHEHRAARLAQGPRQGARRRPRRRRALDR